MTDLARLFRPASVAVVGGGAWCRAVLAQLRKARFSGPVWPVHPKADAVEGYPAFRSVDGLPAAPDACFIGVNRHATIEVVERLAARGAGGAVCFASGFSEAAAEDASGRGLQDRLLAAAGEMPILGPNCYGFINYLDGALLWPDQHGGVARERGVAIVTQSSNILINLTMQVRALPLAYVAAAGNQAQTGFARIGAALLDDPRVTALGLHIEGFGDIRAFEALCARARALGKPIVAIKVGRSAQAQAATVSHTASLAGGDAGAQALMDRLGVARVDDLPTFLETLKLLHFCGPLPSNRIACISCSGGEASLAADTALGHDLEFPPLTPRQRDELRAALGPMVALANPLDYHTYIWRDAPAMTRTWAAMMDPGVAMTMTVVDVPRGDRCDPSDWECTIEAAVGARARTGGNLAYVATLPELLPEALAERLAAEGVVPMMGLREAIAAIDAAARLGRPVAGEDPVLLAPAVADARTPSEAEAKAALAEFGLRVPRSERATTPAEAAAAADRVGFPVVLKGEGVAHKTEAGAVRLGLGDAAAVEAAAKAMPAGGFLVEEMITGAVAELLVGVTHDPAHGYVLTLGAGGVMTEILQDTRSLLIPASRASVAAALDRLKIAPLLRGYRGKPAAHLDAILDAVDAVQAYVTANAGAVAECEINPLICTPDGAIAADALIRRSP